MKEDEFKIDIPEDRGTLDLTRRIEELENTIKGYDFLLVSLKKEIFEAKKISSENEMNKNLFAVWINIFLMFFLMFGIASFFYTPVDSLH